MKDKSLKESFQLLSELTRKLQSNLNPYDTDDDTSFLLKKQLRNKLYGEKPECFIPLKSNYGDDVPFFCLCNRLGTYNHNVINNSMKMVDHMIKHNKYDPEKLDKIKRRLKHMFHRYNKDIPKPHSTMKYKMRHNKRLNNLKNYLNQLNNNDSEL